MLIRLFIFVLYPLVCTSCLLNDKLELDWENQEPLLVVESYLTPDQPYELSMVESNQFSQDFDLLLVEDATVYVRSDKEERRLWNILYENKETKSLINYTSTQDTLLYENELPKTYNLEIETKEGNKLKASTETINQVKIYKYEVNYPTIKVWFNNAENVNHRYYSVRMANLSDTNPSIKNSYFNLSSGENDTLSLEIPIEYPESSEIQLRLSHLTKEHFDFQQSVLQARSANVDPFAIPTQIKSNISGGTGIFTYYTFDEVTLTLKK
ncbi:DUF4249 family protein [Xanthovirga aplysinae]|uniref:DUF4249 family protein n=1 Tax=Xanthovirga aplysinae TaxID=2529853 RepID=UPI0012BCAD79|nr:DUF4249 family protein [Xanthovirga aplysinae]MTI31356.1 DUF4249 family protein [Xanthovirga aplysinae]